MRTPCARAPLWLWTALGLGVLAGCPSPDERPSEERASVRAEPPVLTHHPAVGSVDAMPRELSAAFALTGHFRALPSPKPGDWLAEHEEPGQTVEQFWNSGPNLPGAARDTIYLLPIGTFTGDGAPPLKVLEDYTRAYFGLEVQRLPAVEVDALELTTREHDGHRQLHTRSVLAALVPRLPDDAFCLIGLTMQDLYPDEKWNYVFGYASLSERVGVYGFARYDPAFFGEPRPDDVAKLILQRSTQVMTHEIGHMFGFQHCTHYSCNMNGSNSLEESDAQPPHLCPVCLRKLHASTGNDPLTRYRALGEFYRAQDLSRESLWTDARVRYLEGASESGTRATR